MQLRSSSYVVGLAVESVDDRTGHGRQDRPPEPDEDLRLFDGENRPQLRGAERPAASTGMKSMA